MHAYPEGVRLEDRPCPNGCTQNDSLVLEGGDRLHGIAGRFKVMRCVHCGLMRTNPRPTPETIGAYYPGDYGPYRTAAAPIASRRAGLKQRLKRALSLETRATPPIPVGRLLEIGCANGIYMDQMRRVGWSVEGIEFSAPAAEQARARGFDVQTATVETAQKPAQPVDVVAAWMVLEHLHEPVSALQKVRSWVKPDGYLIASIPDARAWERRLFGDRWYALQLPTHLYHYTPETIATVLHSAGWELKRISWQRNCNNLLWSLQYLCADKGWTRLGKMTSWLRTTGAASHGRLLLGWLLGVTHQSGRMEIWAQPDRKRGSRLT